MASAAPRLYVALYTDEDIDGELAAQICANGFDAIATAEAQNLGLADEAQLEFAISRGRAILTHNAKDFALLFDEYWQKGRDHFGIVVSEQLPLGELLRRVLMMLDQIDAEQMKNSYHNLGEFK